MERVRRTLADAGFALALFAAYLLFLFLASSSLFALFSPTIPFWSGVLLLVIGLAGILVTWHLSSVYA